ncbi:MAG: hypothetical protein AAFN92_16235, partial [Bacteroidota bacterium]
MSLPLAGQDCPSIAATLKQLYERPGEIEAVHAEVVAACPSHLDTLSIAYHKRSVYAFSSGEGLAPAIAFAQRALAVQQELYRDTMALPLAKSLYNLGLFYRNDYQPLVAKRYLARAEKAFVQ